LTFLMSAGRRNREGGLKVAIEKRRRSGWTLRFSPP
jgi:hypothetical protein